MSNDGVENSLKLKNPLHISSAMSLKYMNQV